MSDKIMVYRTTASAYIQIGKDLYRNEKRIHSPIVGCADQEHKNTIHIRKEGYQNLIELEIKVGKCLIRDDPENKPYAGVSTPLKEIKTLSRNDFPKDLSNDELVKKIIMGMIE